MEMGTVMIIITIKGVSLMMMIAADQMSLQPIAQNVCAVILWAANPIFANQMKTAVVMDIVRKNIVFAYPTTTT